MSESVVRFRDGVFQLRCPMCGWWWDLTTDHWRPENGMQRCRSCWREYHRIHEAARNRDDAVRLVKNFKNRLRYAENREARLASNRRWKAANRERTRIYNRAYQARRRAA